jgi:hypothetical protein
MCIPGGLLYNMWGVLPSFRFPVSVAAKKNMISILQKWKKHFSWDETKIGLHGVPLHPNINKFYF